MSRSDEHNITLSTTGKVVGANLLLWVVLVIVGSVTFDIGSSYGEPIYAGIVLFIFSIALGLLNIIVSVILLICKKDSLGQGFLLSGAIIGIIGFSLCLGATALSLV